MVTDGASRPGAVVLVGDEWPTHRPGGLNRYLADLASGLRDHDVDARAVVLGPAPGAPPWVRAVARADDPLVARVIRLARETAIAAAGCEVVDVHFPLYGIVPVFTRLRRLPMVFHFQGPWAAESGLAGRGSRPTLAIKRQVERAVHRRARRFVTLSEAFKQLLVQDYGVPPWDVRVIPPGVDLERFSPGDKTGARRALGLTMSTRLVLAVRRLDPRMGLDLLLHAWAVVARERPDALLAIVGTGPSGAELRQRAASLGLEERVRFVGAVDDAALTAWYRAADLTVVPSVALEGFGLVVLEALACGTPVIVSDAGALPEAVRGLGLGLGRGLVVPAGDVSAWAERLGRALDAPETLPGASHCRQHAEAYSWHGVVEAHKSLYAEATKPSRARYRVVYLDHCAEISGAELTLVDLIGALDPMEAHVILGSDGPLVARLRARGVSTEVMEMGAQARTLAKQRVRATHPPVRALLESFGYTLRLARRLRRLGPDLVHTNSTKAAFYGGMAGRLAGIPVIWHVHDQVVPEQFPPLARRLIRTLARWVPDGIAANSRSTLELVATGPRPSAVVPSIVVSPAPAAARPWNGNDRPLRIGTLGRLSAIKGQDVFLSAFARAFPNNTAVAVIVGQALFNDQAFEGHLHSLARELGLDGRVDFRGHRDDVVAELAELDVFVHASVVPEAFGRAVVEAMAAGLPVIACDAGGPAELIEHGRTGILVAPGDVNAMAGAMGRLARSPDLRDQLGQAAERAASSFTAERLADSVLGLYGEALARRRRR